MKIWTNRALYLGHNVVAPLLQIGTILSGASAASKMLALTSVSSYGLTALTSAASLATVLFLPREYHPLGSQLSIFGKYASVVGAAAQLLMGISLLLLGMYTLGLWNIAMAIMVLIPFLLSTLATQLGLIEDKATSRSVRMNFAHARLALGTLYLAARLA